MCGRIAAEQSGSVRDRCVPRRLARAHGDQLGPRARKMLGCNREQAPARLACAPWALCHALRASQSTRSHGKHQPERRHDGAGAEHEPGEVGLREPPLSCRAGLQRGFFLCARYARQLGVDASYPACAYHPTANIFFAHPAWLPSRHSDMHNPLNRRIWTRLSGWCGRGAVVRRRPIPIWSCTKPVTLPRHAPRKTCPAHSTRRQAHLARRPAS